ncbi:MAG: Gfo/Idh/MocA family oxidoreductase [Pseudomonadota bacterium]
MEHRLNVLLVGYGSIGRRHLFNLTQLDGIDEIIVYTKIKNDFKGVYEKKVTFIDASALGLSETCERFKIDFAIIANQTDKHIDTAITLAQYGQDLLIEKPLSHNLEKIEILEGIARSGKIKIAIGYNLRYLPAIRSIRDQIARKTLGDLYFAQIEVGQYLPSWRGNIRYSDAYCANIEHGGGAALDLSHEVDYMRYLFGEPCQWKTLKTKASDLEINSEDIFAGIYRYRQGYVCHVHMDYLQRKTMRKIRIVGSRGSLLCDMIEKWMEIGSDDHKIRLTEEGLFNLEETYREELRLFINHITMNTEPDISLQDGIKALKLLEDGHD